MMNCRFCNAQLEENSLLCPSCGGLNTIRMEDADLEYEETAESDEEQFPEEALLSDEASYDEEQPEQVIKPKAKWWKIVLAVVSGAALLFCLTAAILVPMGINLFDQIGDLFKGRENNVQYKDAYVTEDEKAVQQADVVVATIGDKQLTNSALQIYYSSQVYDYLQYYSSALSMLGLDHTQPLSEQICYFNAELTWEQFFLDMSIKTWQRYMLINLLAEEAGHGYTEEELAELAGLTDEWEAMAKQYGYASGDELIQINYGCNTNMASYLDYLNVVRLSETYSALKYEEFLPNMEQLETYYTEHQAEFIKSGITKDSGPIVDVRHLLVKPKGGTTAEDGKTVTYSEEDWAACLQEAEALYEQWKAGEATEASFAALATEHTEDLGSVSTGGLYQQITASSNLVTEFLDWCIDADRQTGDTEIVKTDYGYHIMYFVDGEEQWIVASETNYVADRITQMLEENMERWPISVNYKKIVLASDGLVS